MEPNLEAIHILKSEFTRRHERNARYSMGAFAKSIGLSHTVLSLVLSGKRTLSKRAAELVSERLSLDPKTKALLQAPSGGSMGESAIGSVSRSINGATAGWARAKLKLAREYQKIEMKLFHLISNWAHYAILSLVEIETTLLTPRKIAKALGITEAHAKIAF